MDDCLDLSILDGGSKEFAILFARCGNDMALGRIPFGTELTNLAAFRDRIERSAKGLDDRPASGELAAFGRRLFSFTFQDEILKLYDRLPARHVRIHLLSNQAELQKLPWEFLQEPGAVPGPQLRRSVIRIVPTVGMTPDPPPSLEKGLRVLFVAAAPADQDPVDFQLVKKAIERAFKAKVHEDRFTIEAVDGATRDSFRAAVARQDYDILHFSGHGDVGHDGKGRLLLINRRDTRKTDFINSEALCRLICGRGIRLVILSACDTAKGNFQEDFAVIAEALVRRGIPAVIANQMGVENKSIAPFVGAVYDKLLTDGDIDLAVGEGRLALQMEAEAQNPQAAAIEWGIPALYRHHAATQLYQP